VLLVDRAADERFSQVVVVALGGVDQVHAELPRASEQLVQLRLGEAPSHSPPSCQVPSPIIETLSPVLPSLRTFIAATSGPVASVAATGAHIIVRPTHGQCW
jgi:hypothetical protein